jgi:hypothetical protein
MHSAQVRRLRALHRRLLAQHGADEEQSGVWSPTLEFARDERGTGGYERGHAGGSRRGLDSRDVEMHEEVRGDGGIGWSGARGDVGVVGGRVHCLAGLVGFNGAHASAQNLLRILEWCAADAECIAPLGANLTNHRYEQAGFRV